LLLKGAVGGICALANMLGQECCNLAILSQQGKLEEARHLQLKLIAPNQAVRFVLIRLPSLRPKPLIWRELLICQNYCKFMHL